MDTVPTLVISREAGINTLAVEVAATGEVRITPNKIVFLNKYWGAYLLCLYVILLKKRMRRTLREKDELNVFILNILTYEQDANITGNCK